MVKFLSGEALRQNFTFFLGNYPLEYHICLLFAEGGYHDEGGVAGIQSFTQAATMEFSDIWGVRAKSFSGQWLRGKIFIDIL